MIEPAKPNVTQADNPRSEALAADKSLGELQDEVWLTVQSRHAQRLIFGRATTLSKPSITGLMGFADRLRVIWNAARADDPYADWWLIKVDEAWERARSRIKLEQAALDNCIQQCSALQIRVATTDKPYRVALNFTNPYAYSGAQLIAEFDTTARTALTAKHVGLISGALAERTLGGCAGAIRSLFAVPQGYRVLRINREAVKAGGSAAREAADVMGELPQSVLLGKHSAVLTPRRAKS